MLEIESRQRQHKKVGLGQNLQTRKNVGINHEQKRQHKKGWIR